MPIPVRKTVATLPFEALRAALRVVLCSLVVFFEALRAHATCSHLCCSNSGGAEIGTPDHN